MTTDVNVTEKVADEIRGAVFGQELPEAPIDLATAALDALADPEVLAGIAGVLRGYWPESGGQAAYEAAERERIAASAAVVEWLRGEQA